MADENKHGSHGKSSDNPRAPFGRGMTSPDSTQVPLSAETGEPDEEAIRGRAGQQSNEDASGGSSSGGSSSGGSSSGGSSSGGSSSGGSSSGGASGGNR